MKEISELEEKAKNLLSRLPEEPRKELLDLANNYVVALSEKNIFSEGEYDALTSGYLKMIKLISLMPEPYNHLAEAHKRIYQHLKTKDRILTNFFQNGSRNS